MCFVCTPVCVPFEVGAPAVHFVASWIRTLALHIFSSSEEAWPYSSRCAGRP